MAWTPGIESRARPRRDRVSGKIDGADGHPEPFSDPASTLKARSAI